MTDNITKIGLVRIYDKEGGKELAIFSVADADTSIAILEAAGARGFYAEFLGVSRLVTEAGMEHATQALDELAEFRDTLASVDDLLECIKTKAWGEYGGEPGEPEKGEPEKGEPEKGDDTSEHPLVVLGVEDTTDGRRFDVAMRINLSGVAASDYAEATNTALKAVANMAGAPVSRIEVIRDDTFTGPTDEDPGRGLI